MSPDNKPAPSNTSSKGDTSPKPATQAADTKPRKTLTKKPKRNPAEAILLAQEQERAQAKRAALEKLNADNLFYLRCPRNQNHQAVYLLEYPEGDTLHPGQWFSIEHRPGQPWHNPRLRCQECLVDGDQHSWLWVRAHQMPDGQVAFSLAHPSGVKKKYDGNGAGHLYTISRAELEERLGFEIEELFSDEEESEELVASGAKGGE